MSEISKGNLVKRAILYFRSLSLGQRGIAVFLVVWFTGFGMMNLLWQGMKTLPNLQKLPGLYDYRAASVGDGMLLPLLISAGYAFVQRLPKLSDKQVWWVRGSRALGFVSGLMLQMQWVVTPSTNPNWTIPCAELGCVKFCGHGWVPFLSNKD